MMSISEHHINCFCGQPVDRIETSVSTNCPRCGANTRGLVATWSAHPAALTGASIAS